MRGADGQSKLISGKYGRHRNQSGAGALRIGQVLLTDLLAYRDDNASPADHGAESKRQRDGHFDPVGNEPCRFVEPALVVIQRRGFIGGKTGIVVLLHQPDGFAGEVHVVADIGLILSWNRLEFLVKDHFAIHILNQAAEGKNGGRLQFLGTDIGGDLGARICARGAGGILVLGQDLPRLLRGGDELLHLHGTDSVIERVGRGDGTNENEHDQAHSFLSVIGAMVEADTGAGANQQGANGPRRRLVVLGRFIERGELDQPLCNKNQKACHYKAHQRRNEQGL